MLSYVFEFVLIVLLADFLSAVVHHALDAYGRSDCPLIGKAVNEPNWIHHLFPRKFLDNSLVQNSEPLLVLAAMILLASWLADILTWQVWVFAGIVASTNLIHRAAHQSRKENGWLVSALQDLYIIQRREQHSMHHRSGQDTHYAPITNFVNPLLEATQFWRHWERLIECVVGVKPRRFPPRE